MPPKLASVPGSMGPNLDRSGIVKVSSRPGAAERLRISAALRDAGVPDEARPDLIDAIARVGSYLPSAGIRSDDDRAQVAAEIARLEESGVVRSRAVHMAWMAQITGQQSLLLAGDTDDRVSTYRDGIDSDKRALMERLRSRSREAPAPASSKTPRADPQAWDDLPDMDWEE